MLRIPSDDAGAVWGSAGTIRDPLVSTQCATTVRFRRIALPRRDWRLVQVRKRPGVCIRIVWKVKNGGGGGI